MSKRAATAKLQEFWPEIRTSLCIRQPHQQQTESILRTMNEKLRTRKTVILTYLSTRAVCLTHLIFLDFMRVTILDSSASWPGIPGNLIGPQHQSQTARLIASHSYTYSQP